MSIAGENRTCLTRSKVLHVSGILPIGAYACPRQLHHFLLCRPILNQVRHTERHIHRDHEGDQEEGYIVRK